MSALIDHQPTSTRMIWRDNLTDFRRKFFTYANRADWLVLFAGCWNTSCHPSMDVVPHVRHAPSIDTTRVAARSRFSPICSIGFRATHSRSTTSQHLLCDKISRGPPPEWITVAFYEMPELLECAGFSVEWWSQLLGDVRCAGRLGFLVQSFLLI